MQASLHFPARSGVRALPARHGSMHLRQDVTNNFGMRPGCNRSETLTGTSQRFVLETEVP